MNEYIRDIVGGLMVASQIAIIAAIMAVIVVAGGYAGIWLWELL